MRRYRFDGLLLLFALLGWTACSDDDSAADDRDGGRGEALRVIVGTPSPAGDLKFIPLEQGGDIPLGTFGQGGTHAELAVRCVGFGNQAFVDVTVLNVESGSAVRTLPSSRPQLLICRQDPAGACDLLPLYVMTGGLADPSEKDGLRVRVSADVHSPDGQHASASQEGILRKDF